MIDPKTVLLGIPSHTGSLSCELSGMLVNYGHQYFGGLTMPTECSHPSLVRNIIADTFLRSPFEWLVGIDSDMVAGPDDFQYLLEETDSHASYYNSETGLAIAHRVQDWGKEVPPQPTRVEARLAPDALTQATLSELRGPCDVLVNCEYAYKREPFEPVQFGLGFYRVHRSVFSILQQLTHRDNGRVEVDRLAYESVIGAACEGEVSNDLLTLLIESKTSQAGTPRLWQATYEGRVFYDYYPSGPITDLHVPNGQWMGEDHGFWTLCRLAGLIPRIERRTRLLHLGRKAYPYEGPDTGSAQ